MKTKAFIIFLCVIISSNAWSAPQWWQQVYPSDSNSQITLKDENNNSITAITNPTAASVKTSSTTNTRPPTVVIQATATLPIAVRNTACDSTKNTVAITSDRTMLLTCQSNVWLADMSQGNITSDGKIKSTMWQPTTVVTENTSDANCVVADSTTWGRTAKSSTGLILSCQSGSWKKAQGGSGSFYSIGNGGYRYRSACTSSGPPYASCLRVNAVTGACSCPGGSTAVVVSGVTNTCGPTFNPPFTSTTIAYSCE